RPGGRRGAEGEEDRHPHRVRRLPAVRDLHLRHARGRPRHQGADADGGGEEGGRWQGTREEMTLAVSMAEDGYATGGQCRCLDLNVDARRRSGRWAPWSHPHRGRQDGLSKKPESDRTRTSQLSRLPRLLSRRDASQSRFTARAPAQLAVRAWRVSPL